MEFVSKNTQKYSNKFIAAFLKSSFWLWYCLNKFESLDSMLFDIFNDICVPHITSDTNKMKAVKEVEKLVDEIIAMEKDFLSINNRKNSMQLQEKNDQICKQFMEINNKIYKIIELSEDEIITVKTCLQKNKIFTGEINLKIDKGTEGHLYS